MSDDDDPTDADEIEHMDLSDRLVQVLGRDLEDWRERLLLAIRLSDMPLEQLRALAARLTPRPATWRTRAAASRPATRDHTRHRPPTAGTCSPRGRRAR